MRQYMARLQVLARRQAAKRCQKKIRWVKTCFHRDANAQQLGCHARYSSCCEYWEWHRSASRGRLWFIAAALSGSIPQNYRSRWGLTPGDDSSKEFAYRMFLARVLRSPSDCSGSGGAAARPGSKFKLRFSVCAKSRFLPEARRKVPKET